MNLYIYTARKKGHLLPAITGIGWGETIKRFESVALEICGKDIDFICVSDIRKCLDSDVPSFLLKKAKKPSLMDLFGE